MTEIIDSIYVKADLEQLASNANQLNAEERAQLLRLLQDFEDLFDVNLGDWDTKPVNLELNPDSKPFNYKFYPVPSVYSTNGIN